MNWITLKALNQVFREGKTHKRKTLVEDSDIQFMLNSTGELMETRKTIFDPNHDEEEPSDFQINYEQNFLKQFETYTNFLKDIGFDKPQTRWHEKDIQILMGIKRRMDSGELADLRNQIIEYNESIRGVSLMFFKNDKYLDHRDSLIDALKIILDVPEFANSRDKQYIYKLECKKPKLIVLCENIYFLTMPDIPRMHHIELWYVGGSNTAMLEFADTRNLPIYYSCDWDYHGLKIYERIREWIDHISLLLPVGEPKSIRETEHKSPWLPNASNGLSDLDDVLFNQKEQELIRSLIKNDCWVIEESNKLLDMLKLNDALPLIASQKDWTKSKSN